MRTVALAVVAAMAAGCVQAEAAVYAFTPGPLTPAESTLYTQDSLSFSIGIDDAAVRAGSFNYDYRFRYLQSGNPPQTTYTPSAIGDVSAFQFFKIGGSTFTGDSTGSGSDYVTIALNFTATGQIASGNVQYSTDGPFLFASGTGAAFTGFEGTGSQRPANISGPLVAVATVPEPATLSLLAVAFGAVGVRRRQLAVVMSNAE